MSPATLNGLRGMQHLQNEFAPIGRPTPDHLPSKNDNAVAQHAEPIPASQVDLTESLTLSESPLPKIEPVPYPIRALQERIDHAKNSNHSIKQQLYQGKESPLSADNTDPNNAVPNTVRSLLDVLKDANQGLNDEVTGKFQRLMTQFDENKISKTELQTQALSLVNQQIPSIRAQA